MKKMKTSGRIFLGIVGKLLLLLLVPNLSLGAGRRRATLPREFSQDPSLGSPTGRARRVLDLQPVPSVSVELPDGEQAQLGAAFELSVIDQLHQTGKYLVLNHLPDPLVSQSRFALSVETAEEKSVEPGWFWFSSNTPTATIELQVKEVSFIAGNRGDRIFYGFSEALELPTGLPTDGLVGKSRRVINEFPPSNLPWFGSAFSRKGTSPFDSASGLELGEGFSIFYGYGTVGLKYARYLAKVIVEAKVRAPLAHEFQELRRIEAKGEGFYFDLAVSYDGFKASLGAARKTAMQDAIKSALSAVAPAVARSTQDLPLVGRVDYVTPEGVLLLGTGIGSQIPAGTRYVIVDPSGRRTQPGFVTVQKSEMSGAIGAYLQEAPPSNPVSTAVADTMTAAPSTVAYQPKVGDLLRQYTPAWDDTFTQFRQNQARAPQLLQFKTGEGEGGSADVAVQAQALQIATAPPDEVFESVSVPPLELDPNRAGASGSRITRSALSEVLSLLTLPYRIWRYFQYDKPYPSNRLTTFYTSSALKKQKELLNWVRGAADFPAKLKAPDSLTPAGGAPLVAVLDSGVDYLHPGISPSIVGLNLAAHEKIQPSEQVGWDFVSMDPRPYDDHYHGTQVASLIAAVAPQAQILPIKVFSPYGTTSSTALFSGFKYALKRGAKIIVCAWGTAVESATLKQAIVEAKKQGVWVVAPLSKIEANEFPALFAASEENLLVIEGDARRLRVAEPRKKRTEASHFTLNVGLLAGAVARSLSGRQEDDEIGPLSRSELVQRLKALGLQTSGDRFHF